MPYFFSSLLRLLYLLGISSCQTNSLGFCSSSFIFPRAFITHWLAHYSPFSPFAMFLDLLANWALFFPLDSYNSFTLLLPLMYLWAHSLSFPSHLAYWAFTSFLGLSWPICFNCVSSILFLLHLPLLSGFFLPLGLLSKTGINI